MKLVNRPQFDERSLKVGTPVRLKINQPKRGSGNYPIPMSSQSDKFTSGDYGLVLSINALKLIVLLVDKKQVCIDVNDVAGGSIQIIELVEKEDDIELEE